ncbi:MULTISPECIES: glycosyl hydrolase [unclassified Nocardioides]|uniref:glycosyl hydrolase n=1 Tax=unclassified Nocardioides TaxID=2615069 RepID=UPI0030143442
MRRLRKRSISLAAAAVVGLGSITLATTTGTPAASAAADGASSSISADEFSTPDMTYRPGVRWWWSGGSIKTDVLAEQLEYLASHGFGTVEINPYRVVPNVPDAQLQDIYTPAFYEKLEFAVAKADELGITVDLNMGSGWNANSQFTTIADSEGNLSLGRATLTGAQVKAGGIAVPALTKSLQYGAAVTPRFAPELARLQGVVVAKRTGTAGAVTGDARLFDDGATVWDQRVTLDVNDSHFVDASEIGGTSFRLDPAVTTAMADGDSYEVVALWSLPAGASGAGTTTARPDWFTVDHMDAAKTLRYVNQWVGEANLSRIVSTYDNVRALFNDSLELHTDLYYNEGISALAKDAEHNGLGYDFSKYLPTVYRQNLNTAAYRPNTMGGSADSYLTYTTDSATTNRILADYRTLVGVKMAEGLRGFQKGSNSHGLLFRQQAYNPPMDIIGSAEYVDIPEDEQHDEYRLITASSGANLHDRNLVTAEQFTLGLTPMQNTLDTLRVGFDLMATGGVNNFFYHGLSYPYGKGSAQYGENGWAAFPTIGVNMTEDNTLAPYFGQLNAYASRLNYLMQQGDPSRDVAVYAPYNTRAVATGATPTLNANGYAWDVINDKSIQAADTTFADGRLSVNGGKASYDALVVHTSTVPVETMQSLLRLAEQGAPIVFYGALPNAQAGYADGRYAALDRQVATLANQVLLKGDAAYNPTSEASLASTLKRVVTPELTYDTNTEVRFTRRTLDDGGELTYLRNTSTTANTITVRVDEKYENFYWLDQKTGEIHDADVRDGAVTFTLDAGKDPLGRGSTPSKPSNGIALLAEPAGVTIPAADLTPGLPDGVDRVAPASTLPVTAQSLTVSDDNLDGVLGGPVQTQTFTESVLGNWKDATYQGGTLRSVVSDGVYRATVDVTPEKGRRYVLDLGEVHTAARVTVNGQDAGSVIFAPYELDVTSLLKAGANQVEIAVTPRKKNRYFPAATNTNGQYSMAAPQDAGLVGPLTLDVSPLAATSPAAVTAPRITGTPVVGRTLTADPGTWDVAGVGFAYQWLRGGTPIAGATGASYRVVTADAGRALAVRVTATKAGYGPGVAASRTATVARLGSTARVALSARKITAGQAVRVTVRVAAPGLAGPTGTVRVTRNGAVVRTVALRAADRGVVTVRLPKLRRGTYRIAASYLGDAQVAPSRATAVRVKVRARR